MVEVIKSRQRLDHYLAELYPQVSRAFLQKLCSSNQVLVNGEAQKSGFKLKSDDTVKVLYDISAIGAVESIDLPVIFEDEDVMVINKPAGVIAHARGRYWNEPSVASFAREKTGQSGERAGIVHRLDRATSGIMIIAKHQAALSWLQKQFADRKVNKIYLAIVTGQIKPEEAIIDIPIERNPKAPATFRTGNNGKPAQTYYKLLKSSEHYIPMRNYFPAFSSALPVQKLPKYDNRSISYANKISKPFAPQIIDSKNRKAISHGYSLIELHPHTGRTHQLRVHMKHLGHPIVGDSLYEGEKADRMMLHAQSLKITLPSGKQQTFEATMPEIFNNYVNDD